MEPATEPSDQDAALPLLDYAEDDDDRRPIVQRRAKTSMFSIKPTKLVRPPRGVDASRARAGDMRMVYSLTAFVSIGALLFGYDQGVMGVIVADERWIDLMHPANPWVTGAVISLYDIGCFIGAMMIGILADSCGRERMLSIASFIFVIGATLQASSYTVAQIITGRIILGVGVGICAGGVPLYISEISPAKLRGRIVGIEQMILCLGELIAFWLNYGFNMLETVHWWRIPLAIQIIPAIFLGVGCWWWVPPSPRWLVDQGRFDCAQEVLTRLHGSDVANLELREIKNSLSLQKTVAKARWVEMFRLPVVRVTMLGMGIQFLQQVTGTNSILYYTPSLFERGGIKDPHTRNLATGGVGIVLFLSAWIPIFLFDKLGRKTWLQIGTVGMMCAMIGIATLQWNAGKHPDAKGNSAIIFFPFMFYTFFNATWGVGSWLYASEIWPIRYRAKGNALSTASLWMGTFVVAQLSPVIADAIGWGLYVIYAGICVIAFLFVRYALVETRNKTLEEMSRLFGIDEKLLRHVESAQSYDNLDQRTKDITEPPSPVALNAALDHE